MSVRNFKRRSGPLWKEFKSQWLSRPVEMVIAYRSFEFDEHAVKHLPNYEADATCFLLHIVSSINGTIHSERPLISNHKAMTHDRWEQRRTVIVRMGGNIFYLNNYPSLKVRQLPGETFKLVIAPTNGDNVEIDFIRKHP